MAAYHTSRFVRTKIVRDFSLACVIGPTGRRALPHRIPKVQSGSTLDKKADRLKVASERRLMQRRRMRMRSHRVVPAGIFACIQKQPDNVRVTELSRQRQGAM